VHDTDGQTTHAMNAGLVPLAGRAPALVAAAGERASYCFFEFFTAQIRNPNTRRAYARAAVEFFDWLAARGVTDRKTSSASGTVEPFTPVSNSNRECQLAMLLLPRAFV
jgi:hypothetical protein